MASCAGCQAPLAPLRNRGNPRKWCSEACRIRAFTVASPAYRERQAELAAARYKAAYAPPCYPLKCATCCEDFVAHRRNTKFCSRKCRARSDYLGRYARRVGAEREPYTFGEVAERDGWICGICQQGIEQGLRYPHPRAGSVDHIQPLSRGGSDLLVNIQVAHLICNWRKNNRIAEPDMGNTPDMGGQHGRQRAGAETV